MLSDNIVEPMRRQLIRWHFRRTLQGIFATAPLVPGERPFTTLSMVQHSDVAAYLVAIKSFARFLQPHRIIVVCDPSITPDDERLLRQHIPHITLHCANTYYHPQLPVGGTWERLHALAHHAATDYTVQLDSDTVTLAPLPEVAAAIDHSEGFVLDGFLPGDDDDDQPAMGLVALEHASAYAQRWPPRHVQALAEQQLVHAGLSLTHYIRGCSGFTGLPPDPAHLDRVLELSRKMQIRLGERWTEWGTEQVASNYLVANAAGTRLLPMPHYSAAGPSIDDHAFIHFIGSTRFINRNYEKAVRRVISMLHQT